MAEAKLIEDESLYDAIFHRKSVRKYQSDPLEEDILKEVNQFLRGLVPLYDDIKTQFIFLGPEDVKSKIPQPSAPHYIAAFSQEKEGYRTNMGFMLQQMDLFLSANGIGSCWLGIPKPRKEIVDSNPLEYVILLGFGASKEEIHRFNIKEFKRKSVDEISDIDLNKEFLEPVRLAPSSVNNQPWFFSGDEKRIEVYCRKPNFLKARLIKKWTPVDMGIAIYHLWLHFKVQGQEIHIVQEPPSRGGREGFHYLLTLKIT